MAANEINTTASHAVSSAQLLASRTQGLVACVFDVSDDLTGGAEREAIIEARGKLESLVAAMDSNLEQVLSLLDQIEAERNAMLDALRDGGRIGRAVIAVATERI